MTNSRFATSTDGTQICFEVFGESNASPTIVLTHGWSNDRAIWSRHFASLAETHRVVRLDLAGFGDSEAQRTAWSMDAFGEDVASVVRTLEIERAVLVGFSMGGIAALEAALDIPERVVGVVLVDVLQSPDASLPAEARGAAIEDIRENWNDPAWVRAFAFAENSPDSLIREAIDRLPAKPPDHWWPSLHEALRWIDEDVVGTLERIEVPVAAINSDRVPTDVEAYRRYIPSFSVRLMPGVGHLGVIWEDVEDFDRHLRGIIEEMTA